MGVALLDDPPLRVVGVGRVPAGEGDGGEPPLLPRALVPGVGDRVGALEGGLGEAVQGIVGVGGGLRTRIGRGGEVAGGVEQSVRRAALRGGWIVIALRCTRYSSPGSMLAAKPQGNSMIL